MASINLSYDVIGSITNCHNDSLGLKLVYLWILTFFYVIFYVFIKIHEYAKLLFCITWHRMKGLCLSFKMRPVSIRRNRDMANFVRCAKGFMEKDNQHNWHGIPVHMQCGLIPCTLKSCSFY